MVDNLLEKMFESVAQVIAPVPTVYIKTLKDIFDTKSAQNKKNSIANLAGTEPDMRDRKAYFKAFKQALDRPDDTAGKVVDTGGLGYGLIQEMQVIHKLNENAIVDKIMLSKGGSSGNPHETKIIFESEKVKKLYETNPQFKRKIDEIAETMQGRTIYVKLDEYQHGRKITKASDVTKKPPKKPDLWDELLEWLNKNKGEVAIILAIVILLVAFVLK